MERKWRNFNKPLFVKIKRAIRNYNLIEDKDTICVALSGGKDSTLLLYSLEILRRTLPYKFELKALSVDMGWNNDFSYHEKFCKTLGIPFEIIKTTIGPIIFEERKEKNPCSLCARMRRGAVNHWANTNNCNKVALGHHLDDAIETLLMSLFFEGRLHTFNPKSYLSNTDVTVIRPLIYVHELDIKAIVKKLDLPIMHNMCPADGYTQRSKEKELITLLSKQNPGIRERMMHAIESGLWCSMKEG